MLLATVNGLTGTSATAAEPGDSPTAVAVAGDFNSEIGCPADWSPDCDQVQLNRRANDGIWALTLALPAGTYAYKAALNRSWDESYGQHATLGGPDISLVVPAGGRAVTFLYDEVSHWITDTVAAPMVTAAGDFQSELGCPGDWLRTACARGCRTRR